MSPINVFLFDDSIPKIPEFIEQDVYKNGSVNQSNLKVLAKFEWPGESGLQELTANLVNHPYADAGSVSVVGFLHPHFYLDRRNEFPAPDIAIFDWEYGLTIDTSAEGMLLDFLTHTEAFVFVYSSFKEHIPSSLVKSTFDKFAGRFQLFAKGNTTNSVLSSEDFIFQYVLTRVSKDNNIKVQSRDVRFEASGYLKNPADIRFLESILGRESLLKSIKDLGSELSEATVEKMIHEANGVLLIDSKRRFLMTSDATVYIERFGPTIEISYLEVLRDFGIAKLTEALEIGLARV